MNHVPPERLNELSAHHTPVVYRKHQVIIMYTTVEASRSFDDDVSGVSFADAPTTHAVLSSVLVEHFAVQPQPKESNLITRFGFSPSTRVADARYQYCILYT